jgi:PPM family protein phosphatase
MELLSIGEFASRSGLSARALRLYDEMGLLPPTRTDPHSGYRWYAAEQLERAGMVVAPGTPDRPSTGR